LLKINEGILTNTQRMWVNSPSNWITCDPRAHGSDTSLPQKWGRSLWTRWVFPNSITL